MNHDILNAIARRRGFNLLEMFNTRFKHRFAETDFRWIAQWGFDFVRIPISCEVWTDKETCLLVDEEMLAEVDRAVSLGKQYGIHVCLNFHRAPGYCSNDRPPFGTTLWKDAGMQELFCRHWEIFALRYTGVGPETLSFNLVNEPPPISQERMTRQDHERVVRAAVGAIRKIDPARPIIADGVGFGTIPCPELADLGVIQSCRAYVPLGISHFNASWMAGSDAWPHPQWPGAFHPDTPLWDRAALEEHYAPWKALMNQGVPVHCGEGGAFSRTPHAVVLAWYRDVLEILKEHGMGHALWNFRGLFGILDSGRSDVVYEDWEEHKLDRSLLSLLQEF